jgi:hypothetical protein
LHDSSDERRKGLEQELEAFVTILPDLINCNTDAVAESEAAVLALKGQELGIPNNPFPRHLEGSLPFPNAPLINE